MNDWHQSQRGYFAGALYDAMKEDKSIFLLVGDLGYKVFDKHFEDFPDRCINCGASEAAMVGIAVGLALKGKKPFVYTISSFFLRAAETISNYISKEQIAVRLVGSGRDQDYKHDGPSHDATAAQDFLSKMEIVEYYPQRLETIPDIVETMVKQDVPSFVSLRR